MLVTIQKVDGNIKFYGSEFGQEPILTIYNDEFNAMLSYAAIHSAKEAVEVASAVMISSLFIDSLRLKATDINSFKKNNIEVTYFNVGDLSTKETLYSGRKVLNWLVSDKIVTVNKKERLKYQFLKFSYRDRLVISYRPVAW